MPSFDAEIQSAAGGGAYVGVPDDVNAALGGGARIPVRATFDGVDYRGSVVTMSGVRCIGLLKDIRQQLGKAPGDVVSVTLERDDTPRTVDVPEDLAAALAAAGVRERFDALSYSHRREHVNAVVEAKKPETRARRVAKAVEMVRG